MTLDAVAQLAHQHGAPETEAVEFFAERAAIREYVGGMTREQAEVEALEDTRLWMALWVRLKGYPRVQLALKGVTP